MIFIPCAMVKFDGSDESSSWGWISHQIFGILIHQYTFWIQPWYTVDGSIRNHLHHGCHGCKLTVAQMDYPTPEPSCSHERMGMGWQWKYHLSCWIKEPWSISICAIKRMHLFFCAWVSLVAPTKTHTLLQVYADVHSLCLEQLVWVSIITFAHGLLC